MRNKIHYFVLAFIFLFEMLFCGLASCDSQGAETPDNCLVVYYFHGNFRCASCRKIELYTRGAIEKYFSKELKADKLIYKVVNVEQKENSHFVKDYQLYTRSVVASLVKGGREVKHETLAKVWEYLGNKQNFYNYIDEEVSKFLKEL